MIVNTKFRMILNFLKKLANIVLHYELYIP